MVFYEDSITHVDKSWLSNRTKFWILSRTKMGNSMSGQDFFTELRRIVNGHLHESKDIKKFQISWLIIIIFKSNYCLQCEIWTDLPFLEYLQPNSWINLRAQTILIYQKTPNSNKTTHLNNSTKYYSIQKKRVLVCACVSSKSRQSFQQTESIAK